MLNFVFDLDKKRYNNHRHDYSDQNAQKKVISIFYIILYYIL